MPTQYLSPFKALSQRAPTCLRIRVSFDTCIWCCARQDSTPRTRGWGMFRVVTWQWEAEDAL